MAGQKKRSSERRESMSYEVDPKTVFELAISKHIEVVRDLQRQQDMLESIARTMSEALLKGGKILWCGNGGSAADSQHLAAEIVGRFRRERRGLPSIALTTDSSVLTSIANDYGYQCVFARQVEALARPGDVLVGISTSGNSQNVVMALHQGRAMDLQTVAFTGGDGGKMSQIADHALLIPSNDTARIQETHILAGHMICDWLELAWLNSSQSESMGQGNEAP